MNENADNERGSSFIWQSAYFLTDYLLKKTQNKNKTIKNLMKKNLKLFLKIFENQICIHSYNVQH